jgi:hypothetical protein
MLENNHLNQLEMEKKYLWKTQAVLESSGE